MRICLDGGVTEEDGLGKDDDIKGKRPSQVIDLEAKELLDETAANETAKGNDDAGDGMAEDKSYLNETFSAAASDSGDGDEPSIQKGSFVKLLGASVIGAIIALTGQQFMPRLITSEETNQLDALRQQVAALEGNFKDSSRLGRAETSTQFKTLENQIKEMRALKAGSKNFEPRLEQVEQTLADLSRVTEGGSETIAGVAAIATKVNSLEGRVQALLAEMKSELQAKIAEDLATLSDGAGSKDQQAEIEAVKLTASNMGNKLASIEEQAQQITRNLNDMSGALSKLQRDGVSSVQLSEEMSPVLSQLKAIDERLELVNKREKEAHEAARRSALALAFANLKRVMDRGDGFGSELSAVKRLAAGDVDFSGLEKLSATGISTEKALLKQYPALAVEALAQTTKGDDGSAWQKIVSKARTTFRYRRTGDVEGKSSEAILARMEHKFKEGHVEDVLVQSKELDPVAMSVMGPWLDKLAARLQVETATQELEQQLLSSLEPR